MDRFLFVLRVPYDYTPGQPTTLTALNAWFDSMGTDRVDPGRGIIEAASVGDTGPATRIGGYLAVTAEDMEAALTVAKGCPLIGLGGGVEVGRTGGGAPTTAPQA